jgi:hypothetical protein
MKIEGSGSGSISQRHGSAVPDPHQNVMDPQHCFEPRTLPLLTHLFTVVRESLRAQALKIQNTEVKGYRATTLIGILTKQAKGEAPCFVL